MKTKILINCPCLKHLGGVANHYLGLKPYWTECVKYLPISKRSRKRGSGKYWLPLDICKFIYQLIFFRPDIILLNPSIGLNALKRDFLFLNIAKLFGKKVGIFIHGFDIPTYESLDNKWLRTELNKASVIFVLAEDFKNRLTNIGVTTPIELSTTKVDDSLVKDFDISIRDGKSRELLFLARVEKAKGIYETIDTFKILKNEFPNLRLKIVGDGSELENIKRKISDENLQDITVTGRLSGKDIINAYKAANLLLLTTHGEGMPTTVLEAMAFGLPVITRPVGGLVDFFENEKMGFIDSTLNPVKIADGVRPFLLNPELTKSVARYNHEYALKKFMASSVANRMEKLLKKYI